MPRAALLAAALLVVVAAVVGVVAGRDAGEDLEEPTPAWRTAAERGLAWDDAASPVRPPLLDPAAEQVTGDPRGPGSLPVQVEDTARAAAESSPLAGERFAILASHYLNYQMTDTPIDAAGVESLFAEPDGPAAAYAKSEAAAQVIGAAGTPSMRHLDLDAGSWVASTVDEDGTVVTNYVARVGIVLAGEPFETWVSFGSASVWTGDRWQLVAWTNDAMLDDDPDRPSARPAVTATGPFAWREVPGCVECSRRPPHDGPGRQRRPPRSARVSSCS
ncbi:hypothetical protein ACOACO_16755 [Nocardioides sp. CPCC 205120]|uniref:hypothetical protein n=1 Tax=Nocardioides sp. CPCC 205120 TaxID=3406462 RepID=UPI003B51511C